MAKILWRIGKIYESVVIVLFMKRFTNKKVLLLILSLLLLLPLTLIMLDTTETKAPESIKKEVEIALSHYPELQNVPIEFKFKKHIKKSTMQAQPKFGSLLKFKSKRSYVVLISKNIKISDTKFKTEDIPKDVMVGWIGHELGHIVDYQSRSNLNLIAFGLRYLYSPEFIKSAERTADSIAVENGMGNYIVATKNFILDHAEIAETYKERLRKFYLSPEEIMVMIKNIEDVD